MKEKLLSTAMKRTGEWVFSNEIPSDVTVQVAETPFFLHKFPLASKCGYIRKLISESNHHADASAIIELVDVPGGAEAFELAAKFCYGVNFEMSIENIAMLRCVAEYLEMTEEYSVRNLVARTDSYLNEVALKSLQGSVSVLHKSENLFPIAEKAKVVSRCIDSIAYIVCKENQICNSREESITEDIISSVESHQTDVIDWWAEDLTVLRIDIFQRVLIAMMARGFKQFALGPILMLYAQKSLRGSELNLKGRSKIDAGEEHEKRVILETIVSLLPREKSVISVSFISMLLREAIYLETTVSCRVDLEKRMALRLGQAALDDLLIPTYSLTGETLFDVDTVQRILMNYCYNNNESDTAGKDLASSESELFSSPQNDLDRVGKLIECFLAEIATDHHLPVTKFVGIAELIPQHSRPIEDGIYRAIDIYLKAHPTLSDIERKKICSVMDCQKLSREACSHAAQNDRLPVQIVVQVLYYEQQRLRDAMELASPSPFSKINNPYPSYSDHPSYDLSTLKKENKELKSELVKLRMKLREININKSTPMLSVVNSPASYVSPSTDSNFSVPRKSVINSLSKKLFSKLTPFLRPKDHTKPSKNRRHSIS